MVNNRSLPLNLISPTTPAPLTEMFHVLILPYCLFDRGSDVNDPFSGDFHIYASKLPAFQNRLSSFGLSTLVTVTAIDKDQPVWSQVNNQLFSHLDTRGLHLERYPTTLTTLGQQEYTEEGIQFLIPGNNHNGAEKLKAVEQLGRLLTIGLLQDIVSKVRNTVGLEPLLWTCPTLANISGTLPANLHVALGCHICLARQVMDRFVSDDHLECTESPTCLSHCLIAQPTLPMPLPPTAAAPPVPPSVSPLASNIPLPFQSTSEFGQSTLLASAAGLSTGPLALSDHTMSLFECVGQSQAPEDFASTSAGYILAAWQFEVGRNLWEPINSDGHVLSPPGDTTLAPSVPRLCISAPDVNSTAEGLINAGGIGAGVEHAVLQRVIEFSTDDLKLVHGNCDILTGYKNLNILSIFNSPQRCHDFQALGWTCAAYIFITGLAPHPLSPVLPLFAIGGWAALTDLWLIDQVLPDHAAILRQWPIHYDHTLDLSIGSELSTLIIEHLSITTLLKEDRFKFIIPAIYSRSVRTPEDVLSQIKFISAEDVEIIFPEGSIDGLYPGTSQALQPSDEVETLFTHKLHRYLRGSGHPSHPSVETHLPFEEGCNQHNMGAMRARLFLCFATGSKLMPAGVWDIKIQFLNDLPPEHIHHVPGGVSDDWKVIVLMK
ncbi:hypothetical protein PAXRUDRAFT_16902 [Paxillus rubicundulus Ve08.2h10]|uniref:Uncharacterized protein n=1 Tax=Paxillus rubicundulus Ve08.2h10 TaxID=930991 RepID=A0A0D0C5J8_9AGAM|nr:hypothetical protein PAXRUDRAFT_16902 [Paxillus rubicundulus Ve08.2h10]